jgi:nucleoside 2-deoxyribosyltransferase
VIAARCALDGILLHGQSTPRTPAFRYVHGLHRPELTHPSDSRQSISAAADCVLRFGMVDGEGVVRGRRVVFDPQDGTRPALFQANGSKADELVVVLNEREAVAMTRLPDADPVSLAKTVRAANSAKGVVLKRGPFGALVCDEDEVVEVPAYATEHVWKIGSGDVFAAHLAYRWMADGLSLAQSADLASRATAVYCDTQAFPLPQSLNSFDRRAVIASPQYRAGYRANVYLAGPFFSLAQQWIVEQARSNLGSFGLEVFSPLHDVGPGSAETVVESDLEGIRRADIVFAIADGLDAGTIYEIGYARALSKPVVVYCENEGAEDRKMMIGSDCVMRDDYVSAIYATLWVAAAL